MFAKPDYLLDPQNTLLGLIDPQLAFGKVVPVPNVDKAVANMARAAEAWTEIGGLTFVTKHIYKAEDELGRVVDFIPNIFKVLKEGSPYTEFHPQLQELSWDKIIRKTEFNAFHNKELVNFIFQENITTIIVCGLTTPICVEATVRRIHEHHIRVVLLSDACASQAMEKESAEEAHEHAVDRMGYTLAQIMTTGEFIKKLKS